MISNLNDRRSQPRASILLTREKLRFSGLRLRKYIAKQRETLYKALD